MDSIWCATTQQPGFGSLNEDIKTDVLIIGGGMAGLLCAWMLASAGVDHTLVEAGRICSGITRNTTAKITCQHGLIYDKLVKKLGIFKAGMYLEANQAALEQYRSLCKTIPCDFEEKDAFVYSRDNPEKLEKELAALEKLHFPAGFTSELPLPFETAGAVRFGAQAQFNPLKFANSICQKLSIYENTKVLELSDGLAVTTGGQIRAEKIIVATHFPFLNTHGSYFLKMYQHRSYVLALRGAQDVHGMYIDEYKKGFSFRNYGDYLLLGGGSHRTGKKGGSYPELTAFADAYYPNAKRVCQWATQDCMTLDSIPYIGNYSARTPNLYVATGFNKWGMTSSMVAAELLRDLILGKENPYAEVFSPSRNMLCGQLFANGLEAVCNLLTPTVPRCPHMGCALKYNRAEHSWDCPCHGSRFAEDGTLLDNPATADKELD